MYSYYGRYIPNTYIVYVNKCNWDSTTNTQFLTFVNHLGFYYLLLFVIQLLYLCTACLRFDDSASRDPRPSYSPYILMTKYEITLEPSWINIIHYYIVKRHILFIYCSLYRSILTPVRYKQPISKYNKNLVNNIYYMFML